jgi:hypothetical protein
MCRTLDLLLNGGITSVFGRFGFCMGLVMNLNWIGCFRKTLSACFAFASEFGRFWCAFVFLDVCDDIFAIGFTRFSTTNGIVFSEKLCVLHFSEAACLYKNFVDKMDVFGIYQNFVMSLKLRR